CRRPRPCGSRASGRRAWPAHYPSAPMRVRRYHRAYGPSPLARAAPTNPLPKEGPMPTTEEVRAALRNVMDPEIGKPIEDVGMLKDIRIEDATVTVTVLLTIEGCPLRERIETDVTAAVAPLSGVEHVQVVLGTMSDEERGALVTSLREIGRASCRER